MMRQKSKFLSISLMFLILSCSQFDDKQDKILNTDEIKLFNAYKFYIPDKFERKDEHNWEYHTENEVGKLYLALVHNPSGEIDSILHDFRKEVFKENLEKYEYVKSDSISKDNKKGIIKFYKMRENKDQSKLYAFYTYHSVGVLKLNQVLFKIRTVSLGFNLNPTIEKHFFQTKHVKNNSADLGQELKNMTIFSTHSLAAPKKYDFNGERTSKKLELKYKKSPKIVYYLRSERLEENIDLGYYLKSYKNNMINNNMTVKQMSYQGLKALFGKKELGNNQNQRAYLYQLHFLNNGKAQTIQMASDKQSDKEFKKYINEIKVIRN